MIQLETLNGKIRDRIYPTELDTVYSDILKYIKKPDYPEYNDDDGNKYIMYVKSNIKLFNKGKEIKLSDNISFNEDDNVLNICIKNKIFCYNNCWKKIYFDEKNIKKQIIYKIKEDGRLINLVKEKDQTIEICKLAVQQNGRALKYIKNQTEEICKLAVQQYGKALKSVKKQTEEICKLAIQQNNDAFELVKEQTDELCKFAVQRYGRNIYHVKNQTEEICKLAIQQDYSALENIENQTEEICKFAVQQDGRALEYAQIRTLEICIIALEQDMSALSFIDNKYNFIEAILGKFKYYKKKIKKLRGKIKLTRK